MPGSIEDEFEAETMILRRRLLASLPREFKQARVAQARRESGQRSMFDALASSPDGPRGEGRDPCELLPESAADPKWTDARLIAEERRVLGLCMAVDPLGRHGDILRVFSTHDVAPFLEELADGSRAVLGGIIRDLKVKASKSGGKSTIRFVIEGVGGPVNAMAWSNSPALVGGQLQDGFLGFVEGKCSRRREPPDLIAENLIPIGQAPGRLATGYLVRCPGTAFDAIRLHQFAEEYPGPLNLVALEPGRRPRKVGREFRVRAGTDVLAGLASVWGAANVGIVGFRGVVKWDPDQSQNK